MFRCQGFGEVHDHFYKLISPVTAPTMDSESAQSQFRVGLGTCRNLYLFFSIKSRYLNDRSQQGIGQVHGMFHHNIVSLSFEDRVREHMHFEVKVTLRSAIGTRKAFTGQAQFFAFADARWDLDAGVFVSSAAIDGEFFLRSLCRFFKGDGDFAHHVLTFAGPSGLSTAKEIFKTRGGTTASKAKIAEYFVDVESAENIFLGVSFLKSLGAELVILISLIFVLEYRVGLIDFFEFLFSLRIVLVMVGMVLQTPFS